MRLSFLLASIAIASVTGCAGTPPKPVYNSERFAVDSPFEMRLAVPAERACALGQRVLLSQGYQVELSEPDRVAGKKYFQPEVSHQMQLEIALICLADGNGTIVYANALQTRSELKSRTNNTGFSVAGIGSISLPWSSEKEEMIKVGEETVTDPAFYERLFDLLRTLARS